MAIVNPMMSIVIPVFNGEAYLAECLQSVCTQSISCFEVLIRDDLSTDRSREIIESFADKRIQYIAGEKNLGLFGNVNTLLRMARAPLVRVLCQDDVMEFDCVETEIDFFERNQSIGMSYCKAHVLNESSCIIGQWPIHDVPEIMSPSLSLQLFYYYGCIVGNLSGACIRKSVLEEVGYFDEYHYPIAGDYEMWVRICKKYNLGVIHKYILRVRAHQSQLSLAKKSSLLCIQESRTIRSSLFPLLPPPIKGWARVYTRLRHDVLDVNYAVSCLRKGDIHAFLRVVYILQVKNFIFAFVFWLITANNNIYRPDVYVIQSSIGAGILPPSHTDQV